tara:strand:+ start:42 stop:242 length:201 start_codon:yes stop_codon:yes gene_type:complete
MELKELHTFMCTGEETLIGAIDSNGNDITINIPTYQLLNTLDIPYMKDKLIQHIKGIAVDNNKLNK